MRTKITAWASSSRWSHFYVTDIPYIIYKLQEWVKSFAIFWYMLIRRVYNTWNKEFKPWEIATIDGSFVIGGALTHSAMLHSMLGLKAIQVNMKCTPIWKLMLWEFKLGYDATEITKNICCTKKKKWWYISSQLSKRIVQVNSLAL